MAVDQADLQRSELLGCLPPAALDTLAERARRRRYAGGEIVFEEGAPGDAMHLVRSGVLEVRRVEGVERYVLARLGPGYAFGELAVLDRTSRTATVVAVEASETVEIGAEDLHAVLAAHPEAVRRMLGSLSQKALIPTTGCSSGAFQRTQDLRHSQLEIYRLGQVAELHDPGTGRHITRMSRVCAHRGKVIDLPPAECETLLLAAPMHDIGKVGVPTPSSTSQGPSTTPTATACAGTRRWARRSSPAAARRSCGWPRRSRSRTTSTGTARATRAGCAGPRSRWWVVSAPSATSSTRWSPPARTSTRGRSTRRSRSSSARLGVLLDPALVAALLGMRDDLPRLIAPGEGEYEL